MARCKECKGLGCIKCEYTGVILHSIIEEQFEEASELDGTRTHPDDIGYINFEEEDYEV